MENGLYTTKDPNQTALAFEGLPEPGEVEAHLLELRGNVELIHREMTHLELMVITGSFEVPPGGGNSMIEIIEKSNAQLLNLYERLKIVNGLLESKFGATPIG